MSGLFDQVVKEMKSHPVTLILVLIALGSASVGYSTYARASDLQALKANLELQSRVQTCRWLSDKIDSHESDIRLLEKDGAEDDWIEEKKADLKRLKERYAATNCASMVY